MDEFISITIFLFFLKKKRERIQLAFEGDEAENSFSLN
jgi:hypothetical protein